MVNRAAKRFIRAPFGLETKTPPSGSGPDSEEKTVRGGAHTALDYGNIRSEVGANTDHEAATEAFEFIGTFFCTLIPAAQLIRQIIGVHID